MESRIDYKAAPAGALQAMSAIDRYVRQSGLEPALVELVKMRASQINGCAYCIDMHSKDARAPRAKASNAYTFSARGARRPFSRTGSAPPSNGPKLSRWCHKTTSPTMYMRASGVNSPKLN